MRVGHKLEKKNVTSSLENFFIIIKLINYGFIAYLYFFKKPLKL